MKTAIILGTSRSSGNTAGLVELYRQYQEVEFFDLNDVEILCYDYEHKNDSDDFLPLFKNLMTYQHLIFATPVYWYAMSAQMKTFFDRFSDLLSIAPELGRELRGKSCSLLATGTDVEPPACFEQPFSLTADYLGMKYLGMFYASCDGDFIPQQHRSKLQRYINGEIFDNNI